MIHILVEDSDNGFQFCKLIKSLFFDTKSLNVKLETLNGVWGLKQKIQDKVNMVNVDDIIIVVYDDIVENPIINRNIIETLEYVNEYDLSKRVLWLPTYSFEIELLLIDGFEFFANYARYAQFFGKLRDRFKKTNSLKTLTIESKNDALYANMYEKAKAKKLKVRMYLELDSDDFERAITIETISKDIFKEVFKYDAPLKSSDFVDKPLGGEDERNCWKNDCCNRAKRCKNAYLNLNYIIDMQKTEKMYKTKFLILHTSYLKLIETVYKLEKISEAITSIDIKDFINTKISKNDYDKHGLKELEWW